MKFLLPFILFSFCYPLVYGQVGDLIWSDEFNDGSLDLTKWSYETGTGVNGNWGTGQLDRATDRDENVSFQNDVGDADGGCLVITTRKEQYIDRDYTSGRIRTAGKVSWGPGHRIVARVMPRDVKHQGQGFAFWMMPDEIPAGYDYIMWPQGGEIDIMEYVGAIPFNNLGTVHYAWSWENNEYQDWNHGHLGAYYNYKNQEVPNPAEPGYGNFPPDDGDPNAGSSGFHSYGIDWYSRRIEFFVDDHVYHIHYFNDGDGYAKDGEDQIGIFNLEGRRVGISEYSNHFSQWHPFEHKMYAILSAGVGGGPYTYGGAIVPEANFPCSVFVDWVRVYELNEVITGLNTEKEQFCFRVFPNPTNEALQIKIEKPENYTVSIIDLNGKVQLKSRLNSSASLDISGLQKGEYLVVLTNGKLSMSRKIIKN